VPTSTAFSAVVGKSGSVVRYTNVDAGITPVTTLYNPGGINFTQVIATETEWFAAGNDGKVYSGPVGATTGTPLIWTLTGANVAKPTRICWAKHRLWAVNGNKIYELTYTAPGAEAAIYSHPTTGWTYSDCTDGPGGVLFSGYGDGTSGIHRITLNTDGGIPTLSGAATVMQLPTDEKVLRCSSLANQMVCMVTNYGRTRRFRRFIAPAGSGGFRSVTRTSCGASILRLKSKRACSLTRPTWKRPARLGHWRSVRAASLW
jgi:hypothetical protein